MYKDLSLKEKAKVLLYGGKLGLTSVEDIAKLYDDAIRGRVIKDNNGYYTHSKENDMLIEGDSTGTNITMKGIPFKVDAWDNLGNYQKLEPNGEYYFPGSMVREHALNGHLALEGKKFNKKWKALDNILYNVYPDTSFTREKTGIGDIDIFDKTDSDTLTYPNGYSIINPYPGQNTIIYNPKVNDELDVRLDALHFMPLDEVYDALNTIYRYYASGDIYDDAKSKHDEDILKYGFEYMPLQRYMDNEADAKLRNHLIQGSREYIESKNYYPDKLQLRKDDYFLVPYIDEILKYLETGERPKYILPEVVITPNEYKKGGPIVSPYGYIGGSWRNNDKFIPAPWLVGNQYLLGGGYNKYSIFDKWKELVTKKLEEYNLMPIVNDVPITLPEVIIQDESILQKDYDNLRLTLKSNPFVLASAVLDPFMSTVLANKNPNDLMEAAKNLLDIYEKMLQATMVSSLGKNVLFGSIPEKISTIGSLFGAYGADKVQSKIIQEASDNKYSSWENMLLDFGVPNSIGMFVNPAYLIGGKYGGKYANHVGRNATEAVVRLGDLANNPNEGAKILLKNPNTYKFVFGNRPDLAYKVGTGYSGEAAVTRETYYNPEYESLAHKGDLIDVYFGKSKSRFPLVGRDRVSNEMNNYIDENYAGREVPVYDMGEVVSPYNALNTMDLYLYTADMSSKYQSTPSVRRYNKNTFEYDNLLDPGNFHVANRSLTPTKYVLYNEDLFKWNPKDYFNQRRESRPKDLLTKGVTNLGLRAINEYGNPFVSLWSEVVNVNPYNKYKKGGSIHIDPKNKGKLTETMRRTGKSKYELAHSKNPLTRKRALFAINASHWKHDEGGYLYSEGGFLLAPYLYNE